MKHLPAVFLSAVVLLFAAPLADAESILSVDFQLTDSPVEGGFYAFEVNNPGTSGTVAKTFGDYTVTVYQGAGAIGGRDRGTVTETGAFTYGDLLRDGVTQIAGSTSSTPTSTNPTATTFSISGLTAGATYSIQIWSWNKGNDAGTVFAWYDTTGGTGTGTSASLLGSITNTQNALPADNNSYSVSATVVADSSGTLSFGQVRSAGSGWMNGFVLSQIPEPSTYAFLVGTITLGCVVLRRRIRHG